MYTIISPKKQRNPPSRAIWMDDHKVKFSKRIIYLGVVFDLGYNCMPHLDLTREKATKVHFLLSRIATDIWEVRPEILKEVYLAVAERIVLYMAPI